MEIIIFQVLNFRTLLHSHQQQKKSEHDEIFDIKHVQLLKSELCCWFFLTVLVIYSTSFKFSKNAI